MDHHEYMFIPINLIQLAIINFYNLHTITNKAKSLPKYAPVCMAFHNLAYSTKKTHSLPEQLWLLPHITHSWHHQWCPISFCLVVDDFSIKYISKEHANHQIQCLCNIIRKLTFTGKADASVASTSNETMPIIPVTTACLAMSKMPFTNSSIPLPKRPKTTHIPPLPNNMA